MFCPKCGAQVAEGSAFCPNCGNQFAAQQPQYQQPQYQQYQQPQYPQYPQQQYQQYHQYQYTPPAHGEPSHGKVGFGEAIRLFFVNYVNFTGRASRSEYWWVFLFAAIVGFVVGLIDGLLDTQVFAIIVELAFLIPSLSLCIRRLHDIGKKWTWILMGLIPLVGQIILIVYYCRESDNDNQWGPRPPMC